MKEIGLMTCYIDNYGACLQAYALQKKIKDLGYDCKIIQYTPVHDAKKLTFSRWVMRFVRDIYRSIKYKEYFKKLTRRKFFADFRKKHLCFNTQNYDTIESLYKQCPNFDAFVCGSDQLWNPLIHNNENNKAYFLDFVPENISRIGYAPSFGISEFPESCKDDLRRLLKKMNYISVREETGADIVEEVIHERPRVVLDPTLLLSKDEWMQIASSVKISKPYILCYIFAEQEYIRSFVQYVHRKTGYDVVVLPFVDIEKEDKYTKIYNAGPSEFVGLIANAAMVLTDSFHATAFSINLNTPFYSLLRNTKDENNNMNTRIFNILGSTGLQDRLITDETPLPKHISMEIDYDGVNLRLEQKRQEDIEFLKNALLKSL